MKLEHRQISIQAGSAVATLDLHLVGAIRALLAGQTKALPGRWGGAGCVLPMPLLRRRVPYRHSPKVIVPKLARIDWDVPPSITTTPSGPNWSKTRMPPYMGVRSPKTASADSYVHVLDFIS